jgi:hypothetical protein
MNAGEFIRNLNAHTPEELAPYVGKHLAWSADGKRVLVAADSLSGLFQQIDRLGVEDYVVDFLGAPDSACLGGGAGF